MSYVSEVTADSPRLWARMDAPSGTSETDIGSGGATGTYSGGFTLNTASLLNSDSDTAVAFNGSTGVLTFADSVAISPTGAVTIEAWFKPAALPGASTIQGIAIKQNAYGLTVEQFGGVTRWVLHVWVGGVDKSVAINTPTPTLGSIFHIVGTYDGANMRLYVNGTQQTSGAQAGAITDSTDALTVARYPLAGTFTNATVDDVAVYATALSAARVLAHYNAGVQISRSASDSVSVSDSASRGSQPQSRSTSDSVSVSDNATRNGTRPRTAADTATVSDTALRTTADPRTATDAASVADSAVRGTTSRARTAADNVTVADSATQAGAHPRTCSDAATVSDSASRSPKSSTRTASDSVSVSDFAVVATATQRTAVDNITVADSAVRHTTNARPAADTVTVADTATRSAPTFIRTATDAVSVTDTATRPATARARSATDSALVSDAATRTPVANARTAADAATVTDTADGATSSHRSASDSVAVGDSAIGQHGTTLTATDTVAVSDSANRSAAGQSRTATDNVAVGDAAVAWTSTARTAHDSITVSDNAVTRTGLGRSASDTANVTDFAVRGPIALYTIAGDLVLVSDNAIILIAPHTISITGSPGRPATDISSDPSRPATDLVGIANAATLITGATP